MNCHPAAKIEVLRGPAVESVHEVDVIIADADGAIVSVWGELDRNVFPRSSIKSLQALLLVESGAAESSGFEQKHLALACSSHNGQPMHVDAAREMLDRIGLSETCLECGAQLPNLPKDNADLVRQGIEPSAIHNNCSGKHAGFLVFASHTGLETQGYANFKSPVQREIAGVLESVVGTPHNEQNQATDGCSIPTYNIPLRKLAVAYAKFGVGACEGNERSKAMLQLRDACLAHPEMVAGDERVCTLLMQALGKRAFVKTGAEGVYTASLPELGYGVAMKARDGNARAVEVAVSAVIEQCLDLNDEEAKCLKPLCEPVLKNRNNIEVGCIRLGR
ncbi:MAG: asparaginase [Rhizobiaceae bacterium]